MEYSDFLNALRAGLVTSVYEDGSTYGVYTDASGTKQYQHFCYGDYRANYAKNGMQDNETDDIHLIPMAES